MNKFVRAVGRHIFRCPHQHSPRRSRAGFRSCGVGTGPHEVAHQDQGLRPAQVRMTPCCHGGPRTRPVALRVSIFHWLAPMTSVVARPDGVSGTNRCERRQVARSHFMFNARTGPVTAQPTRTEKGGRGHQPLWLSVAALGRISGSIRGSAAASLGGVGELAFMRPELAREMEQKPTASASANWPPAWRMTLRAAITLWEKDGRAGGRTKRHSGYRRIHRDASRLADPGNAARVQPWYAVSVLADLPQEAADSGERWVHYTEPSKTGPSSGPGLAG